MKNVEIAKILYEIADILEMQNIAWKPIALRKAARQLENMSDDVSSIYKKLGLQGLKEIPGIGEGISKKIEEYLKTGKIKEYEKLKKSIPKGIGDIMHIPSLGPKKTWRLYKELKITSLEKLESAALSGKIKQLEGFGEKSEKDILAGISMLKTSGKRKLLGDALPIALNIIKKLKRLKEVQHADIAGSLRRKLETVGDIDILVISSKPEKVMDYFTSLDDVSKVIAKGDTKASVLLKSRMNCDIRVIKPKSYGAALLYFTGNKNHNIAVRNIAIKLGYKLSEYGLFKGNKMIAGKTEKEIYDKLHLPCLVPEMREDTGELETFTQKSPPGLIDYSGIKGDLHMHTTWSDGHYNTEDMIKEAIKHSYKYIAVTDHSKSSYIANGLDKKRLMKHLEEIDKLSKKYADDIIVLKGSEVDILKNGSLDYDNSILSKLDIVIAAIHSGFKMPKEEMTSRILNAINNKYVNILAHPTGRLINTRQAYDLDLDKIMIAAKNNDIALEISAYPSRLDLRDANIRKAVSYGAKLIINTDSHSLSDFNFMEYGIAQARRGWATEKDIVNSWQFQKFKKFVSR